MNFKNLYILQIIGLFLLSYVGTGFCQVPSTGKCPSNVVAVNKFSVSDYLGKWYEYAKYPFIFEVGGRCIYTVYGNGKLNGSISVLNSQINSFTSKRSQIDGIATLTNEPGKLSVSFSPAANFGAKSNYWVLGTDYTTYSVVYSCGEYLGGTFHTTVVWILTRDSVPSTQTIEAANKIMDDNNISKAYFLLTNQSNCPNNP